MSSQDTDSNRRDSADPERGTPGLITYDAKDPDTKFPPIRDAAAAEGRAQRAGHPHRRRRLRRRQRLRRAVPHAQLREARRQSGLKYTRFHTTALCSPTRQALLTGRNHHSVGMGGITEIATAAPGYTSMLPEHQGAAGA